MENAKEKTRQDSNKAQAITASILENVLASASKQGAKAKDWEKEFNRYVELKQDKLLQIACSILGCWHSAHDVVQDSFIALHEQLFRKGFDGASIGAWLTVVTTNNALGHLRKAKKHPTTPISGIDEPIAPSQESFAEREEELDEAWRRIEQLPEQQRRAFLMKDVDVESFQEIAEKLSISRAAAKQSYHIARKRLKACRKQSE